MAAFVPDNLAGCNYPIETEIQKKFWGSRHKCNRAKAIIAFSYDKDNAMRNMRRIMGWMHFYRERAWNSFGHFVNTPDMGGIPFTEGNVGWWECMNGGGGIPPVNTKPTVKITSPSVDMVAGNSYPLISTVTGKPTPTVEWTANGENIGSGSSIIFTPEYVMDYTFEVTATNSEGSATDSQTRKTTTPYSVLVPEDITDTVRGFNSVNGSLTPSDIDGKPVLALEVNNSAGSIRLTLKGVGTPFDNISFEYYGVTYNLPIGKIGKYYQNSNKPLATQLYEEMGKHLGKPTPIHFIPGPVSKPIFTLQPKSVTVDVGDTATFSVEVTNADSLQWQENQSNKWVDISGATGVSYDTAPATAGMDGWRYRCVATNAAGITNSTVGFLNVNQPATEETFGVVDTPESSGGNIFPDNGYSQYSLWSLANNDYPGNLATLGYQCIAQEGDKVTKATTWFDSTAQKGIIGLFEKTDDSLIKVYQTDELVGTADKILEGVTVDVNPAITLEAGKTYVVGFMSTDTTGDRTAVNVENRGDSIAWDADAGPNFADTYTIADASDKGQASPSYFTILRTPAKRWDDSRDWVDGTSW